MKTNKIKKADFGSMLGGMGISKIMKSDKIPGGGGGLLGKAFGMKKGGSVKKAKSGASLGMKSVKSGFDNNPGVTRADVIVAAKKKAKNGTIVPKKNSVSKNVGNLNKAKSGTSMKKCKYGCK